MADPVIRLDRSKPFSENRGEMTPNDPLYRVKYWQGGLMGGKRILLPFDVHDELVPDDAAEKQPFKGHNSEGKEVTYHPLWTEQMRQYRDAKKNRMAATAVPDAMAIQEDGDAKGEDELEGPGADDVNFASWLKGEARYQVHQLRAAAKQRFSKNYDKIIPDLLVDLVRDEKLVPEDQVCPQFQATLKKYDASLANAA